MQMGVIGMHMANEGLTAATFQAFEHSHIVEMFSIDTQVDVDSGIPGVSMSQPVRFSFFTRYNSRHKFMHICILASQ